MNNELYHYGVKGMKWGVRKKYYGGELETGTTLKKGTNIQNISSGSAREIRKGNSPIYASYTKKDNAAYEGFYSMWLSGDKVYKNTLTLQKNVKVASQKEAAEIFRKMVQEDPKRTAKALAKAGAGQTIPSQLFAPYGMLRRHSMYKKYMNAGNEWLETKGYHYFNQLMGTGSGTDLRDKYYKTMRANGYDAIFDSNDINSGVSDRPIILVNPSESVKNTKSILLSQDDIDRAYERFLEND